MKQVKEKKKISGFNILLLLVIALFIYGLLCHIYFAHQVAKYENESQNDEQSYSSENPF